MLRLKTVLQSFAEELKGFTASAVVLIEDGIPVMALGKSSEIDPYSVAAYLTSIVQAKVKAAKFIDEVPSTEDILIARGDYYYFIRLIPEKNYFLYVMTKHDEWLGRIRLIADKCQAQIEEIMG
jgi:predicted regulator of Ras-like GTPase activity (Roadblock/LC7/MglB family)